jgi:hypothetical protein
MGLGFELRVQKRTVLRWLEVRASCLLAGTLPLELKD